MDIEKRKMWQFPWRYKESIALVLGVICIGLLLQIMVGKFNFYLLASPANYILGGIMILFIFLCSFKRKNPIYLWFSGVPFSVTLIGGMLVLSIIMGLTPQVTRLNPHDHDFFSVIGFKQVTTMWSFVLVYMLTLLSLGMLIARRLWNLGRKDYSFCFNHIGLWILLFGAGLGSADMKRYVMHVQEGEAEWRVYSENKDVIELPIAIRLNDFYMEEYAPKLAIIDKHSGDIIPEEKPEFFSVDLKRPSGKIKNWEITLKEYLHEAVRNSDSTYKEVHMPGASPAVKVSIYNTENTETLEGWICGGNSAQLFMTLDVDENHTMVMTQPEPKRFVSYMDVFTEEGSEYKNIELEVNKPMKVGNWMIYQYGYDNQAGKMSTYSSLELVYDPWIYVVYLGIILLGLGSICFVIQGNNKKLKEGDE